MSIRFRVLTTLVVALSLPLQAAAAAPEECGSIPREDGRTELCRTTTVSGRWTSRARVHLEEEATVHVGILHQAFTEPDPDVVVEGEGPLIGVQMIPDLPADERLATKDGFFAYKMADRAASFSPYITLGRYNIQTESYELPAGNWLLYLVTDGTPVTATITFNGLSGQTEVHPDTLVRGKVMTPRYIVDNGAVYRAADADQIGAGGGFVLLIQQAAARLSGSLAWQGVSEDSVCIYPSKPPGQEPPDQHLDCQRSPGQQGWSFVFPVPGGDRRVFKGNFVPEGRYGLSASMIGTSGLLGKRTTLALWLDFD
ncbi:MAG: hypothetical protein ACRDH9_01315 [Actinomycetota bacterium]